MNAPERGHLDRGRHTHRVDPEQQRKRGGAVSALCTDAVRGPAHAAGGKASS